MYKTRILLIAVILLSTIGLSRAEENKLKVTFDMDYMSKWMTKGKQGYGEDGAFLSTLGLDLYNTGFGLSVKHINPDSSNFYTGNDIKDKQRLDYSVFYKNSFFEDQIYKTKYKLSWTYKNYYDQARNKGNVQAWQLKLSWPELFSKKLEPYYITHYEYPAGSGYDMKPHWAGWVHRFGLQVNLDVAELPEPLCLTSEVAYTDGLRAADHDWSYATFGISTKFKVTDSLTFIPEINYQVSMDDSVCERDLTYFKLGFKYKF